MAGSPLFMARPFSSTVGVILPVQESKNERLKLRQWKPVVKVK